MTLNPPPPYMPMRRSPGLFATMLAALAQIGSAPLRGIAGAVRRGFRRPRRRPNTCRAQHRNKLARKISRRKRREWRWNRFYYRCR